MGRVNCNALLVTVIISLIIFMLMSGVVVLAFHNRSYEQRAEHELAARNNLTWAINFILSDTGLNTKPDILKDVEIERGMWGLCLLATVRSQEQKRAFLYGTSLPVSMNACLYLADHGRPLSLTGKTILHGDVYVSTAGMVYERKQLEGSIKLSGPNLPPVDSSFIQYLPASQTVTTIPDSLTQSFFSPTHIIYQNKLVALNNVTLKGRIVVRSDSAIIVNSKCVLDNVILIAPRIEFRKGFAGSVQAFAFDEIIVDDECVFSYLSCLAQNKIQLGRNCRLSGMLLGRDEVSISEGTVINGIVYTKGHTTLQGKVNGIVLTDFFRYRSTTTEYQNYLTDAALDRSKLSEWFVAPPLFTPAEQRKIMQWLE